LRALPEGATENLAAGFVAFAALRLVDLFWLRFRGMSGVGEGDARLFAVAGLWLGFEGLPGALLYGALSALLAAAIARRDGRLEGLRDPLPFGPHLALGLWLAWVFGPLEFGP
jgi:leader peptidase (prepilin peptidase)/N-methyltransferase